MSCDEITFWGRVFVHGGLCTIVCVKRMKSDRRVCVCVCVCVKEREREMCVCVFVSRAMVLLRSTLTA